MKRISFVAVIASIVAAVFLVPAASQVVVVPSKEDRILEKLDRVIANQREMRTALDRITRTLDAREKDAGKVARTEGKE